MPHTSMTYVGHRSGVQSDGDLQSDGSAEGCSPLPKVEVQIVDICEQSIVPEGRRVEQRHPAENRRSFGAAGQSKRAARPDVMM